MSSGKRVAGILALAITVFVVWQALQLRSLGSEFQVGETAKTVWGFGVFFNQQPSAPYDAFSLPIQQNFYLGFRQEMLILLALGFIFDMLVAVI